MENDALTSGVEPGGLNNFRQIKVLCCYILRNISAPIKKNKLPEILQYDEIANYFEVTRAINELVALGNIYIDNDDYMYLTENGKKISDEISFSLPFTIKEKGIDSAMRLLESIKIHEQNNVDISENNGIYSVTCTLFDGDQVIMSIAFNVKSKLLAESIRDNFYKDPFAVYSGNIKMLTKNLNKN